MVYRRLAVRAGTLAVFLALSVALGCSSFTDSTLTASGSLLAAADAFATPVPEVEPDSPVEEPIVLPYWPAPDPFEGYDLPEGWESGTGDAVAPPIADPTPEPAPASWTAGPPSVEASDIIERARAMLGIAYVWGGNTLEGLDCSAYVSRAWGLTRQTTDTLHLYSTPITKDELLPGDAMNLTKRADPRGYGHVRLFAAWANEEHTRMWVYEETPRESIHHVIAYDDRYVPLRRANFISDVTQAPVIPAPAATPRASIAPSGAVAPGSRRQREVPESTATPRTRRSWRTPTSSAIATPALTDTLPAIPTPEPTPAPVVMASFVREPTSTPAATRTRRTRLWSAPAPTATASPTPELTAIPTATAFPTPELTATPTATMPPTPEPTATRRATAPRRLRVSSPPTSTVTETPARTLAPQRTSTRRPRASSTPAPEVKQDAPVVQQASEGGLSAEGPGGEAAQQVTEAAAQVTPTPTAVREGGPASRNTKPGRSTGVKPTRDVAPTPDAAGGDRKRGEGRRR